MPIFRSVTVHAQEACIAKNAIFELKRGFTGCDLVTGCGVAQFVNENLLIVSTLASAVSFCNSPGFDPSA